MVQRKIEYTDEFFDELIARLLGQTRVHYNLADARIAGMILQENKKLILKEKFLNDLK